jgi:hypothetical protein
MIRIIALAVVLCFNGSHFLSAKEGKADWTVLFDGESTEAWRGFKRPDFPSGGWEVREGLLISIGGGDRIDLITRERFTDFDLELEWKVEHRGNSGIFFRVSEEASAIWHDAPEIQILDDHGRNQRPDGLQATGSLYDLVPASAEKEVKPAGEFNHSRLRLQGDQLEQWLNGTKIMSVDLGSDEMKERIAQSKFRDYRGFGQTRNGFVGLQHHGDTVAFRNIRIRSLTEAK